VALNFTLENLTAKGLWVLNWYTPLEGLKGRILKVFCLGSEILYEGRMIKRGNPSPKDYVYLGAGAAVSSEVDLSSAYTLPACREVQVSFRGNIHDVVFEGEQFPRMSEDQRSLDIPGNSVSFAVIPI
jgi:peptidyl-Lys metalloendopeptidase